MYSISFQRYKFDKITENYSLNKLKLKNNDFIVMSPSCKP